MGLLSDKTRTRFGSRMPYYYFGTLLVIPTFLGLFIYPDFINDKDEDGNWYAGKRDAWYITLPAVFNVGWAAV